MMIKIMLQDIAQMNFISKASWIHLANSLALKEVNEGEKLISKNDLRPPYCIILTGKFLQLPNQILHPGDTCGNFNVQVDIVSMEQVSTAAVFSQQVFEELKVMESVTIKMKALISFLEEGIAGFSDLNNYTKEKLVKCFKEVTFLPNTLIIKEGSVVSNAYLIKEGTCSIVSLHNLNGFTQPSKEVKGVRCSFYKDINNKLSLVKTLRGYMSLSTNLYQLRTIGHKEWIGEEMLDKVDFKYECSVITKTAVTALKISRASLKKFPWMIVEWFKNNGKSKLEWQDQRKKELKKSILKIEHLQPSSEFVEEALNQVKMKFPQANARLTTNIHRNNFLNYENKQRNRISRSQCKLLSTFDYLRELIGTKHEPQVRRQKSMDFKKSLNKKVKFIRHKRVNTSPLTRIQRESTSTLRVTKRIILRRPRVVMTSRESKNELMIRRMKEQIESANKSFKVGMRNITVMDLHLLKGTISPNPINEL